MECKSEGGRGYRRDDVVWKGKVSARWNRCNLFEAHSATKESAIIPSEIALIGTQNIRPLEDARLMAQQPWHTKHEYAGIRPPSFLLRRRVLSVDLLPKF